MCTPGDTKPADLQNLNNEGKNLNNAIHIHFSLFRYFCIIEFWKIKSTININIFKYFSFYLHFNKEFLLYFYYLQVLKS